MGSSIGGSGTVRSRGGVRSREGPLSEVYIHLTYSCYLLTNIITIMQQLKIGGNDYSTCTL